MTLESLKEDYKKTFSEPRLSGRFLPEKLQKEFFDKIDAATTLEEFVEATYSISMNPEADKKSNREKHILLRIITWESEPPVDENGKRI